ncbi:MAG: PQQ-binding-like beta-propeller repeat protein [Halobacteriaceae archaeon]
MAGNGAVHGYDAARGDGLWTVPLEGPGPRAATPACAGGVVVLAERVPPAAHAHTGPRTHVYAVDAAEGCARWTRTVDAVSGPTSVPTVAGGRVYLGTASHALALDAADGTVQWTHALEGSGAGAQSPAAASQPVVTAGRVLVGSRAGAVTALASQE